MFGPLNVFRSLPEASSTHSATAQQSPQGSSMKGLCAVVGIGTTAVLHSVLNTEYTVAMETQSRGQSHSRRDDSVLPTSYYSRTTFWRGECRYIECGQSKRVRA